MTDLVTRRVGKKGRKYGRNLNRCPAMKRYNAEMRWITNKLKKLKRLLKKQPNNKQIVQAIKRRIT